MFTRKTQPKYEALTRVLLVQLGRLGDVVASRAAWHAVRKHSPGARISVVTSVRWTELLDAELFPLEAHAYPSGTGIGQAAAALGLIRALRRHRFDLVVDLTGSARSRWLCLLCAPADRRAGWGRAWFYRLGTADVRRPDAAYRDEVERLLASLGLDPDADLPLLRPPAAPDTGPLARLLAGNSPIVILHPGAGRPIRRWPPDRFARVADALTAAGFEPVVAAGDGEESLARTVAALARVPVQVVMPGSLRELIAMLGAARLFVGADSGPLHLAAAAGTPALGLFGPNTARRAAPAGRRVWTIEPEMPCRPCAQDAGACVHPDSTCMERIGPAEVVDAALAILNGTARPSSCFSKHPPIRP